MTLAVKIISSPPTVIAYAISLARDEISRALIIESKKMSSASSMIDRVRKRQAKAQSLKEPSISEVEDEDSELDFDHLTKLRNDWWSRAIKV